MQPTDYVKFCPVCNTTKQNTSLCFNNERFREFTKGYFYLFEPKEDVKICPCCEKGVLEDSPLTFEEFKIIDDVSDSDRQFLEAMIDLKQKDPIEYQLKMSQFKTQLQQQESNKPTNTTPTKDVIRCPKCKSTAITTGARGVNNFWGLLGASKTVNRCGNCGYTWKPNSW